MPAHEAAPGSFNPNPQEVYHATSVRLDQIPENQPGGPLTGDLAVLDRMLTEQTPLALEAPQEQAAPKLIGTARRVGPRHKTAYEEAYDAATPDAAAEGPRHASEEAASTPKGYVGRHRAEAQHASDEVAAESDYVGSHRKERFLVRTFSRLADFANKKAEKWDNRRTTREFAGDQIERGRDTARRIGASVVGSAKSAGEYMANNLRTGIEADKRNAKRVRDFFVTTGRSARAHKDVVVAAARSRIGKMAEGTRNGYESSKHAAKVGGEVLKAAGLVTVGAGVLAAEGAARGVKYGAEKTVAGAKRVGREVKQTGADFQENVADLRAPGKAKRERKAAEREARLDNLAHDLAAARRDKQTRRMSEAEIAEARAKALNR